MKQSKHKKPRARFCWACGRQLWGRHHVEKWIDAHPRILHEGCAEKIEKGQPIFDESARDVHMAEQEFESVIEGAEDLGPVPECYGQGDYACGSEMCDWCPYEQECGGY